MMARVLQNSGGKVGTLYSTWAELQLLVTWAAEGQHYLGLFKLHDSGALSTSFQGVSNSGTETARGWTTLANLRTLPVRCATLAVGHYERAFGATTEPCLQGSPSYKVVKIRPCCWLNTSSDAQVYGFYLQLETEMDMRLSKLALLN